MKRIHPFAWFFAGLALCAGVTVAQVYGYFPPPGLAYSPAPATISTPPPASGNPGNPLTITASNGVGANQNGGGITITGGAADSGAAGTGLGGGITLNAGANGSGTLPTANPLVINFDPNNLFVTTESFLTGSGVSTQYLFQMLNDTTNSEIQFAFWNSATDGFIACSPSDAFTSTESECGLNNAIPAPAAQSSPAFGCVTNKDCWIVAGSQPKPVIRLNGHLGPSNPHDAVIIWGVPFGQAGSTSGQINMQTQAASGSYNWEWPTTAGTAGQYLTSQGGGSTAMTWSGGVLSGTSGSIGGSALLAGQCSSGTTTVTGSTTSMVAIADPNTYPGDGTYWDAQVTAANTVTTKVCAAVALTPTASTYNIRVLQ